MNNCGIKSRELCFSGCGTFLAGFLVLLLLVPVTAGALDTAFVTGNGESLENNLRAWRMKNPNAIVLHAMAEVFTDKVITDEGYKQLVRTRGLQLWFYADKDNVYPDSEIRYFGSRIKETAPGIVFIRGSGEELKKNLVFWKERINKEVTAADMEVTTDHIWTEKGYQRMLITRGMWIFYSARTTSADNRDNGSSSVCDVAPGVVFIEGSGEKLAQRLAEWKKSHGDVSVKATCIEDGTSRTRTGEDFGYEVTARGMWIFYEAEKVVVPAGTREASLSKPPEAEPVPAPYTIAEHYLSKAVAKKESSQPFESLLEDALHWYDEVIEGFSAHPAACASALRKIQIGYLRQLRIDNEELAAVMSRYPAASHRVEMQVIRDLLVLAEKQGDLVAQLLLNQRIIKLYNDQEYSLEAYEAVKAIEKINVHLKSRIPRT